MTRYTYNFRYDQQGVIDYGHYRAKARAARNETRIRVFRSFFVVMAGLVSGSWVYPTSAHKNPEVRQA